MKFAADLRHPVAKAPWPSKMRSTLAPCSSRSHRSPRAPRRVSVRVRVYLRRPARPRPSGSRRGDQLGGVVLSLLSATRSSSMLRQRSRRRSPTRRTGCRICASSSSRCGDESSRFWNSTFRLVMVGRISLWREPAAAVASSCVFCAAAPTSASQVPKVRRNRPSAELRRSDPLGAWRDQSLCSGCRRRQRSLRSGSGECI